MRDYQRKSKYVLPATVYHQTLWTIRDYQRMKDEAESLLIDSGKEMDGMPHGSPSPNGVINKVIRRDAFLEKCQAIEKAFQTIPQEYRQGVVDSIMYHAAFPNNADRSTDGRYKSKVIYMAAYNLGLITEVS